MYIYNILQPNSLNCPGERLRGLLVEISPKHVIDENMDEPYLSTIVARTAVLVQ